MVYQLISHFLSDVTHFRQPAPALGFGMGFAVQQNVTTPNDHGQLVDKAVGHHTGRPMPVPLCVFHCDATPRPNPYRSYSGCGVELECDCNHIELYSYNTAACRALEKVADSCSFGALSSVMLFTQRLRAGLH